MLIFNILINLQTEIKDTVLFFKESQSHLGRLQIFSGALELVFVSYTGTLL